MAIAPLFDILPPYLQKNLEDADHMADHYLLIQSFIDIINRIGDDVERTQSVGYRMTGQCFFGHSRQILSSKYGDKIIDELAMWVADLELEEGATGVGYPKTKEYIVNLLQTLLQKE